MKAERLKQKPSEIKGSFDTVCSMLDLTYVRVNTSFQMTGDAVNKTLLKTLGEGIKSESDYINTFTKTEPEFYSKQEIFYYVSINDSSLLVISKSEHSEDEGAAHPNFYSVSYNFDLLTGNLVKLEDVLLPNYKEKLYQVAEKMFKKQSQEGETFDPINLVLDNSFEIGWDGLGFQYAGTYIGTHDLFIPYTEISELVNPNGVISRLWKQSK